MTWRLANSLGTLRTETNRRFPNRSKVSDGTIGDADHATRDSDHNPWVIDRNGIGVVTAIDITEDDAPGVPEIFDLIAKTLIERRDPRVKYIIHEGKIWRSYDKPGIPAWTPSPYTGDNKHFQHGHISVKPEARFYDSTAPWGIYPAPAPKPAPEEDDMPTAKEVWDHKIPFTSTPTDKIGDVRPAYISLVETHNLALQLKTEVEEMSTKLDTIIAKLGG